MTIRRAVSADLPALQQLWQEVFGDPPAFTDRFYNAFGAECALVAIAGDFIAGDEIANDKIPDGEIVAMLHTLPTALACEGQARWGAYLYALATSPAYRGRGIASRLLAYAESAPFSAPPTLAGAGACGLSVPSRSAIEFTLLIPGEASLFSFYESKGYTRKAAVLSPEAPDYPAHLRQGSQSTPIFLKTEPFYNLSLRIPESVPPPMETALWKPLSDRPFPESTPILSHFMQ